MRAVILKGEERAIDACEGPISDGVCARVPDGSPCACAGSTLIFRPSTVTGGKRLWSFEVRADADYCPLSGLWSSGLPRTGST
jgi:hypothetical protein